MAYRLTGLADKSDTQFDHNKEKRYALAPINAFDPVSGNAKIRYYDPLSYLRRLEQAGVYLQDLIEMNQWRFSLGLRQDWVETLEEKRLAEFNRPVGTEDSLRLGGGVRYVG